VAGHLLDGEMHGRGVFLTQPPKVKSGEVEASKKPRWRVYVGNFANGVMRGRGTMIWDAGVTGPQTTKLQHPLRRFVAWPAEKWLASGALAEFLKAFENFKAKHEVVCGSDAESPGSPARRGSPQVNPQGGLTPFVPTPSDYTLRINVYTGEFDSNKFHGQGTLDFYTGARFRGWFKSGHVADDYEGIVQQTARLKLDASDSGAESTTGANRMSRDIVPKSQRDGATAKGTKADKKQKPAMSKKSRTATWGAGRKTSTAAIVKERRHRRALSHSSAVPTSPLRISAGRLNIPDADFVRASFELRGQFVSTAALQSTGRTSCVSNTLRVRALPPPLAPQGKRNKAREKELQESLTIDICTITGGTWVDGVLSNSCCNVRCACFWRAGLTVAVRGSHVRCYADGLQAAIRGAATTSCHTLGCAISQACECHCPLHTRPTYLTKHIVVV